MPKLNPLRRYLENPYLLSMSITLVAGAIGQGGLMLASLSIKEQRGVIDALGPELCWIGTLSITAPYLSVCLHRHLQNRYRYSSFKLTLYMLVAALASLFLMPILGRLGVKTSFFIWFWRLFPLSIGAFCGLKKLDASGGAKEPAWSPFLVLVSLLIGFWYLFSEKSRFPIEGNLRQRDQWAREVLGESYEIAVRWVQNSSAILEDVGEIQNIGPAARGEQPRYCGVARQWDDRIEFGY